MPESIRRLFFSDSGKIGLESVEGRAPKHKKSTMLNLADSVLSDISYVGKDGGSKTYGHTGSSATSS
jgi:hypothetical protein